MDIGSTHTRVCATCRYRRRRSASQLFSPTELQTPGGLKAYTEWQQQEKQHGERESRLFAAGGLFTYEPHHYDWCAAFTAPLELVEKANLGDRTSLEMLSRQGGGIEVNPITGELSPIYVLCEQENSRLECERHEPL